MHPVASSGTAFMPIVILIFSTLAFWGIYWFVRMGGLEHMREASVRRKEAARLAKARASERVAPLRAVDDPRDAAIILMLLIARESADPTREQIAAIEKIARETFGFDRELPARMTQARFIASRAEGFGHAASVFADLLNSRLTVDEKWQLIDMVERVAALEGTSDAHAEAVAVLSRRIGIATA
jgi:hypothetical protein